MSKFLSENKRSILLSIIAIAALVGFSDAVYLTAAHYSGEAVTCSLINGCSLVLSSSWATFLGAPVSLIGAAYYGSILLGVLAYIYTQKRILLSLLLAMTTIGVVISLAFLYLQLFVIEAVCEYCLLSLISTLTAWGGVLALTRQSWVIE